MRKNKLFPFCSSYINLFQIQQHRFCAVRKLADFCFVFLNINININFLLISGNVKQEIRSNNMYCIVLHGLKKMKCKIGSNCKKIIWFSNCLNVKFIFPVLCCLFCKCINHFLMYSRVICFDSGGRTLFHFVCTAYILAYIW